MAGEFPSPDCWSSCNMRVKMREGGVDDDKGVGNDVEGVQSLVGGEMLSSMREGISVCVMVVVLMVVVRVVVLMVVVGVVVLMTVGSGTGGGVCCEGSPVVFEWEGRFFVTF